jgi:hypothetical protein
VALFLVAQRYSSRHRASGISQATLLALEEEADGCTTRQIAEVALEVATRRG